MQPDRGADQIQTRASGLAIAEDGAVLRLTLARPERRNALSRELVAALVDAFAGIAEDGGTRAVLLAGEGACFCAGGDIAEFVATSAAGRATADAEALADLLAAMVSCPVPVVVRIHGAAFGGGIGLVCAADIAIAATETRFSLSEARLGLVPAVISPYVMAALGVREAEARMLLASPFGAEEALRIGLIHRVAAVDELDAAVGETIADLLRSAPGALTAIKRLPASLAGRDPGEIRRITTNLLAERLGCEEGQEGLRAFLEKRSPSWSP